MILETRRLKLLSPDEVEAGQVCDYYLKNREFLEKFSPRRDAEFYTKAFHEELLSSQKNDWINDKGYRFYITLSQEDTKIIGSIALSNIVRGVFLSCFMGYQLDAEHANRGYMTETVKRIVSFAFEELKLHRIEGNIIPDNLASRAVVEKCGFTMEGISRKYLKINGVWQDHIHYVILNNAMD